MAELTLGTATAVLKDDYKDYIAQFASDVFLLAQLDRSNDVSEGLRAIHALHTSRSSGIGSRSSTGTLPTAASQGYTRAYIPLRFHYGRIQLGGPIIRAMQKDRGSFIRALESEMSGIKDDLQFDHGRQVWGTSDGVLATAGTTTASTTVQLATTTTETQLRQLFNDGGMVVDIGTVASPTAIASARSVTAVDVVNKTITISGAAVTTTASHRVFRNSNGGASSGTNVPDDGQLELTGMQTIVSNTGDLHGVAVASVPSWVSKVDSNSGVNRAVSESLVVKLIQQAQTTNPTADLDLLVSNSGVHRAVYNDMQAMRRNIDNVDLKAGYSGIAFSSVGMGGRGSSQRALVWDRDCPNNKLFGITSKDLVTYEQGSWEWMEDDGAVLSRVPNRDAYEATLFRYYEMAARKRNTHFRIDDLAEA